MVDELDVLVTKNQKVLYNLFDWPTRPGVPLVVLGISNTMNLPEQMMARVNSRLGMTRVDFPAYTRNQLEVIIKLRLEGLDAFDSSAVNLVAAKVAFISGDARRALEICRYMFYINHLTVSRRAVDLAEEEYSLEDTDITDKKVFIKHIDAAMEEMKLSSKTRAVSTTSLHGKIFLCAVLNELKRTGLPEITFAEVRIS
jgi:origin recognition complex subunit 1